MGLLRLSFSHDADGTSIRHTAGPLLTGWQHPELVEDTLLVIAELVHNVLQHTDDGGELALTPRDGAILVEVVDHSSELPRLYPPDHRRAGGRGMLLVNALATRWGTHRTTHGKIVWAQMPPQQPEPPPG